MQETYPGFPKNQCKYHPSSSLRTDITFTNYYVERSNAIDEN